MSLCRPGTGLHSLRHTYVSLMIQLGEDVRYIADQVGHSTTQLTRDVYAHMFSKVRVSAMQRLNAALPHNSNHVAGQAAAPENSTNKVD